MANIKEIKVGDIIYNVKDKLAVTGIKIGEAGSIKSPDSTGTVTLPYNTGGSTGVDTEARAAILTLLDNLASLAFNGVPPTITFDEEPVQITVNVDNSLQNCSVKSLPNSVDVGHTVELIIEADPNYIFEEGSITQSNFEIATDSQEYNWEQSGLVNNSTFKLVFSTVTKPINVTVRDISAVPSNIPWRSIICVSNNFNSWDSSPDIKNHMQVDGRETQKFTFSPRSNYAFTVDDIVVTVYGWTDAQINNKVRKTLLSNGDLEITISGPIDNAVTFYVNPRYKHNIVKKQLDNCTSTPQIDDYILSSDTKEYELSADEGYTMDNASVSVIPSDYCNYNTLTHKLKIAPDSREVPIQIHVIANPVEPDSPTGTAKVTLKLLNLEPIQVEGFTTENNPFGYYEKVVSTAEQFAVNLAPIVQTYTAIDNQTHTVTPELNNDLTVLGIKNNVATTLTLNTDYTFDGSVLNSLNIEEWDYDEIIVSCTASNGAIKFVCDETVTSYSDKPIFIKCANENIMYVTLSPGENWVRLPNKNIEFIGVKYNNNSLIYNLKNAPYLTEIDFGGNLFKFNHDQSLLFNDSLVKLTKIKGLVIKPAQDFSQNMNKWFVNCISLAELDTIGWDLSGVTQMNATFYRCGAEGFKLDLDYMNVNKVTSVTSSENYGLFQACKVEDLRVRGWHLNEENSSPSISFYSLFYSANYLRKIDLSTWTVKNLSSLRTAFGACRNGVNIDISGISTPSVDDENHGQLLESMEGMCANTSVGTLTVGNLNADYEDLNITNIKYSNNTVGEIRFTSSTPLKYSKDWIAALCDPKTSLVFNGDDWYHNNTLITLVRP